MSKNIILVPTDFTKVADTALSHAIMVARKIKGEVVLIHVVESAEEIKTARKIIDDVAKRASEWYDISVTGIIRIGNIFEDIGDAAAELGALMIIMGTHGVRGIQHLVGGYALKVVTSSTVPFIVVQEETAESSYKNMVLPLDLAKDTKQKLGLAASFARFFDSTIHIISPNETDEYLKNQVQRNIIFAKNYFQDHEVKCTAQLAEGSGDFAKDVILFSESVNADLITIINHPTNIFTNLLGESYEQRILTNDLNIPVMCVNPKDIGTLSKSYS